MTKHETVANIHRATLLIGFGDFGLATLRRFLISTATRGILNWEEGLAPDKYERHLRDLALFHVPIVAEQQNTQISSALNEQAVELMRDLYQQIETVDDAQLVHCLERRAKTLLSMDVRAAHDDNLPLGLDVIVLAKPATLAIIGQLRPLLINSVEHLHKFMAHNADSLNFIQILDFDNYWQNATEHLKLRQAVKLEAEHWQQRRAAQQPGFSRIYVVDSQTLSGYKDEKYRIDEISLFLEFLLFEGQRDGDLQFLYQSLPIDGTLVATFGIRLLERSAGLLTRLAAAMFGVGWLDYLAGKLVGTQQEMQALQALMKNYEADSLKQLILQNSPSSELNRYLDELREQLDSLPLEQADWPVQIQNQYEQAFKNIKNDLIRRTQDHINGLLNQRFFSSLSTELQQEIDRCFHHPRHPATLGAVIDELESVLATLNKTPVFNPSMNMTVFEEGIDIKKLHKDHQDYCFFLKKQLDTQGVKKWWPLFGFMLSLGLNTTVMEEMSTFPEPDPLASPVRRILLSAVNYLSSLPPSIVMLALGFLFWAVLAVFGQRAVAGRVLSAKNYWHDLFRSRLKNSLRKLTKTDGELNTKLAASFAQMQQNMTASVQREVIRELNQVLRSLKERQRELNYLHDQLSGFLKYYGIDPKKPDEDWKRMLKEASGIRYAVETYADFQRILNSNPNCPERFVSMQTTKKPFKNWHERYSQSFLYPLLFIDELSREYRDPLEDELAKPGRGQEQETVTAHLKDFLQRNENFSSAFDWQQQDGLPPDKVYCLLPTVWLHLPGIPETLGGHLGITQQNRLSGRNSTRAYLLRIKTGVDTSCLI